MTFPVLHTEQESAHFEALFRYATMGMLITDDAGLITAINPFALNEFGYTEEEVLGKRIELLIPKRYHEKHVQHHAAFLKNPAARKMGNGVELIGISKNGTEFPVEISLSHYSYNGSNFVIAFIKDISERKKAELAIRQMTAELESTVEKRTADLKTIQAELEASLKKEKELSELKSRFVTTASHEFRTPLSTVLSSAYLVEKYTADKDQLKREKHLRHITSSVEMLTSILNDFLSVGKIEEGKINVKPVACNIKEFITAAIQELDAGLKENQEIRYIHKGGTGVTLDPTLMKHILMNLVSNASKFSPENGLIEIGTTLKKGQLLLYVKDNGIGITPDDQKHLAERFFRGSNVSGIQGTGLGLHIVSKYAALLNGSMQCKSEPGRGSTFTIIFNLQKHRYEKDITDRRQ